MGVSTAAHRRKISKAKRRSGEPHAYVVVDIETTGLDVEHDKIIELAAIKVVDGEPAEVMEFFVSDCGPIPLEVTRLTGIDAGSVRCGKPLEEVLACFVDFIGMQPLVMHNSSFDIGFIEAALDDCDMDTLDNQFIDTLEMARKKLPRFSNYKLTDLCAYFGVDTDGAHRAMADCRLTYQLFERLLEYGNG